MFKFDFKVDNISVEEKVFENDCEESVKKSNDESSMEYYDSKEIKPPSNVYENLDIYKANSMEVSAGDVTLTYIKSGDLLQFFDSDTSKDITKAEESHSDLIPGVYEGGAKIWECTEDLITYLSKNYPPENVKKKKVLDLGCGSGVLGIYALNCEALVHFQDYVQIKNNQLHLANSRFRYLRNFLRQFENRGRNMIHFSPQEVKITMYILLNEDVLEKITIPNVFLNLPDNEPNNLDKIKFYSGDWLKFTELTKDDEKFDIILTSETIYNPNSHRKLLDTFDVKLSENGIILLAAKIYYFGVGGGIKQFEELIEKDKRFQSKVVWCSTEGISREILEIKRLVQ